MTNLTFETITFVIYGFRHDLHAKDFEPEVQSMTMHHLPVCSTSTFNDVM